MKIAFTKMSGAGNDFVMIDNRNGSVHLTPSQVAAICHRRFSVGADGLITLEAGKDGFDFQMNYYNADGRLGSMCGNGGRCVTAFARHAGLDQNQFHFAANGKSYDSEILPDGIVSLKMTPPTDFRPVKKIAALENYFCDTGSPHAVIFVEDVENVDVFSLGRKISHAKAYADTSNGGGTNVNFVQVLSQDTIRLRTYERGVEDETLACGTGSVASAVMSAKLGKVAASDIKVIVSGGQLRVRFDAAFQDVYLIGPADITFSGELEI